MHIASWRLAYRGLLPDEVIERLSVPDREALWERRLADEQALGRESRVDVALLAGSLVGFVAAGPSRDDDAAGRGEVYAIYVHPEHWSAGIGQALMAAAVEHLTGIGAGEGLLWVLASNVRARRFYEVGGWSWDGRARTRLLEATGDLDVWVEEACYRRAFA